MSWVGSEVADLYLGSGAVALARPGQAVQWAEHDDAAGSLRASFQELAGSKRHRWFRPTVRMWLSAALARPFLLQPLGGLKGRSESEAMAEATAPEATGFDEPCAVWLAAVPRQQPTVAVAMPVALRQASADMASELGVKLHSLRPWWSRALDEHLQSAPDAAEPFAASDTDGLILLASAGDGTWALAEAFTPSPAPDQRHGLVARRLFACGLQSISVCEATMAEGSAVSAQPWPHVILNTGRARE